MERGAEDRRTIRPAPSVFEGGFFASWHLGELFFELLVFYAQGLCSFSQALRFGHGLSYAFVNVHTPF